MTVSLWQVHVFRLVVPIGFACYVGDLLIGVQPAANLAIGLETVIRRGMPLCLPSLRNVYLQRGQAWKPAPTGLLLEFV